jgi:hypothetical protein
MGFEEPQLLYFLPLAFLPLLIHILHRRKARIIPFAVLEFLLSSNREIRKNIRFRQILVLILRILIACFIIFSLSRPVLLRMSEGAVRVEEKSSVVVVIDDSFSMRYLIKGIPLFEKAKELITELAQNLKGNMEVGIVQASKPVSTAFRQLISRKSELLSAIKNLNVSYGEANLSESLRVAEEILKRSRFERKKILIYSDFADHLFRNESLPSISPDIEIIPVAIGVLEESRNNIAITGVATSRALQISPRHVQAEIEISNFSREPANELVTLKFGENIMKGIIKIDPFKSERKTFILKMGEKEGETGEVFLAPDRLPEDNRREFPVKFEKEMTVLIINGSPSSVQYFDEAYYILKALKPDTESELGIRTRTVNTDEFSPAELENVNVAMLLNVASLLPGQIEILIKFIEQGGGLFISVGDNVSPKEYNSAFGTLLPYPLRDISGIINSENLISSDSHVFIEQWDRKHPVFALFSEGGEGSPSAVSFSKYMMLETGSDENVSILAKYNNGAPAIVERRINKGKVIFFTSTVDRDFCDLPLHSSFVPLIHSISQYLGGAEYEGEDSQVSTGEPIRIKIRENTWKIHVLRPDGIREIFDMKKMSLRKSDFFTYEKTNFPGVYRFFPENSDGSRNFTDYVVAAVPTYEMDLKTADNSKITALEKSFRQAKQFDRAFQTSQISLFPVTVIIILLLISAELMVILRK